MAADRLGGVTAAIELREAAYRLPVVSTSFHGRDIFAPAAAHLALGVPLERLGPLVDPTSLVRLPIPEPRVAAGTLDTHVIYVDTFGNVKLTALAPALGEALGEVPFGSRVDLELQPAGAAERRIGATWADTFGGVEPGAPLLYVDSYGRLCIAVNQGNAAEELDLVEDLAVAIRRAG
jgi:S-adenosylmethionine hydrolase